MFFFFQLLTLHLFIRECSAEQNRSSAAASSTGSLTVTRIQKNFRISPQSFYRRATGPLRRSRRGLSALLTRGHRCGRGEHDSLNFPTQEFSLRG